MEFCDDNIFHKIDNNKNDIEKYIEAKRMLFLIYRTSFNDYYNSYLLGEVKEEPDGIEFHRAENVYYKEIFVNYNISFINFFKNKTEKMNLNDKFKYINEFIKNIKQIIPLNIKNLLNYEYYKYKEDNEKFEYHLVLLPELLENAFDEKERIDLKKMLVPAFELLRFLELELESLKELKRLGITEEKEDKAETKIESEDKTIVNECLKNENGSVIWLKSQDELSRTLLVMLDDENIKNIIIGNSHKFTNNLLFNALSKLNIKIKKNGNLMDIKKNSFLSSYGRSKSDFNNSTKKGGIHYKKENYKATADKLTKLIKQKCTIKK